MKQYEKPTLETITLTQDVITASGEPRPDDCIKICIPANCTPAVPENCRKGN